MIQPNSNTAHIERPRSRWHECHACSNWNDFRIRSSLFESIYCHPSRWVVHCSRVLFVKTYRLRFIQNVKCCCTAEQFGCLKTIWRDGERFVKVWTMRCMHGACALGDNHTFSIYNLPYLWQAFYCSRQATIRNAALSNFSYGQMHVPHPVLPSPLAPLPPPIPTPTESISMLRIWFHSFKSTSERHELLLVCACVRRHSPQ